MPSDVLYNATQAVSSQNAGLYPFNRVVDGYFHEVAPSVAVRNRSVATVPIITGKINRERVQTEDFNNFRFSLGNNLDEGTVFVPPTLNNSAEVVNFFKGVFLCSVSCFVYLPVLA